MKFSSIVFLTPVISLPIALATALAQDDGTGQMTMDPECANKYCVELNNGVLRCANTHNVDTTRFEEMDQKDLDAYVKCYCEELIEPFTGCLTCYKNETLANENKENHRMVCSAGNSTEVPDTSGNNNDTSTGGDDDEFEPETKKNDARDLVLGKLMITGIIVIAGGVIAIL